MESGDPGANAPDSNASNPSPGEAPEDTSAALDLARGEITDDDIATLEQAVDQIDFASRKATPDRLARLRSIALRLSSLAEQVEKGVRTRDPDAPPLSDDDARRSNCHAGARVNFIALEEDDLHEGPP